MKRLLNHTKFNTPEEYERMFGEDRQHDWFDSLRWEKLLKYYKGGTLIDIGCFDSLLPITAKRRYPDAEVWGMDRAKKVIDAMSDIFPQVNYTDGDAYETTFPDNYFDYVVAGELIEHLERPADFFEEAKRILKVGGTLAITTPKEETEAGEVDGLRHVWSFSHDDIKTLSVMFSKVKVGTLRSKYFPKYKYHFPYIISWLTK